MYMEHLVKWRNKTKSKATLVGESDFKNLGIGLDLIPIEVTWFCCDRRRILQEHLENWLFPNIFWLVSGIGHTTRE